MDGCNEGADQNRNSSSEHREEVNPLPTCQLGPGQHSEDGVTGNPQASTPPSGQDLKPSDDYGSSSADSKAEVSGYNSDDEHDAITDLTEEQWIEVEAHFNENLRQKGWLVKPMGDDGACLFRAVADQVFGDQEMHSIVRNQCMDYIALNRDRFQNYMAEPLDDYVARKRNNSAQGNHIELQALSEIYKRPIEIYFYDLEPLTVINGVGEPPDGPIRMVYHRGCHYNSIVDLYGAKYDVPNSTPALPDSNLMREVIQQSEEIITEQAVLQERTIATNLEETDEVLMQPAARESCPQVHSDNKTQQDRTVCASADSTSGTSTESCTTRPNESGVDQELKESCARSCQQPGGSRMRVRKSESSTLPCQQPGGSRMRKRKLESSPLPCQQPGGSRMRKRKRESSPLPCRQSGGSRMRKRKSESSTLPCQQPGGSRMRKRKSESSTLPCQQPGGSRMRKRKRDSSPLPCRQPGRSRMRKRKRESSPLPCQQPGGSRMRTRKRESSPLPCQQPGGSQMRKRKRESSPLPCQQPGGSRMRKRKRESSPLPCQQPGGSRMRTRKRSSEDDAKILVEVLTAIQDEYLNHLRKSSPKDDSEDKD